MKKLLICTLLCALLLSLCGIAAAAKTVEEIGNISFTPGTYGCQDPADFSPVGTVKIDWDPDAANKLNLTDGNMEDWIAAGYNMTFIDGTNMVSWVGDTPIAPEGWSIKAYFVADSDNIYFGLFITDSTFAYGSGGGSYYDGDAIQLAVDFGGKMGEQIEEDPDVLTNPKNIFYSFSCSADGAPIEIYRQESDQDGSLTEDDGVVGSASKTAEGWCAEFSMSWQRLLDDYAWKAWDEDAKVYVGSDENIPLKVGCCLYYLDRSETAGGINWAAGTTNGVTFVDGTPALSWTVHDNGIQLELDYRAGMTFNCDGICIIKGYETVPPSTEPETEPPYEPPYDPPAEETDLPTEAETEPASEALTYPTWVTTAPEAPESEVTDVMNKAEEIDEILAKYGCAGAVGMGGLTALLALAAAAFACRKKH